MPIPTDYGQRLPQWADNHYGLPQARPDSTIGEYGCKLCCYGLILGIPPDELQNAFAKSGVYNPSGTFNYINDAVVAITFSNRLQFIGRMDCPDIPAPLNQVDDLLAAQGFVLSYVYVLTKKGKIQHYVLIIGKDGDTYRIYDPYHNDIALITPRYGKNAAQAICGFIKLVVKHPKPENTEANS